MSLSAKGVKNVWQEHRESLSRIKTQLSDTQSPLPKRGSPVGGKSGRQSHSPYGKYRTSTPPHLPRIETPPEDRRKPLRGNRYEVVPPVRNNRQSNSRGTDYDSWGEESDEESEVDQGDYMPHPYPGNPYPYGAPPPVVFGAPFPIYYPPPPPRRNKKNPKRKENSYSQPSRNDRSPVGYRQPLAERYEDVNKSGPAHPGKRKQNRVKFKDPPPVQNGFYSFPMYPYPYSYEDPYRADKRDSKYKYINPRDTPYSPGHGHSTMNKYMDDPEKIMLYYMKDHPLFAEGLVDGLIDQFMEDLVPDVLIDAFHELSKGTSYGENPLENIRDDIIAEEVPRIINNIVRSTLTEMVDESPVFAGRIRYMLYQESEKDPLESFLTRLLNDAVSEATTDVVKETVKEMARTYIQTQHDGIVYEDLIGDYIKEIGPALVEDAVFEIYAEEFIEEEVIKAELAEEIPEMATEVLTHFDTKVMRRELKEVSSQAGDKLVESIMLDYIFSLLARQGKVWTESDHANKHMDDMMTNIMMEKLFGVILNRRKTVVNKPLKKLHEKVVTDVSVDVMLQQLMASLDEDLLDVDEYERGVSDEPVEHRATPQSIKTNFSYS